MDHLTAAKRLRRLATIGLVASACFSSAGCRPSSPGGETVPTPPRALAEESLRKGGAPGVNPQPAGGGNPAAPR